MNKKSLGVLALSTILLFSSCKKFIDKYFPGHGNDKETCRITEVSQMSFVAEINRTGKFHYSKGLLDSVTFDIFMGSSGAQFYYFKYDNNKRLIEYSADYSREPGDYYIRHKYVYSDNKIIRDTMFVREAGTYTQVKELEYDSQGRVIKEDVVLIEADGVPQNEPQEPNIYEYNEDGNLVQEEYMDAYDDKVNFLRTNPVLQFVQRNYSKNNRIPANSYNEDGLPLSFDVAPIGGFLQWPLPIAIKYKCD